MYPGSFLSSERLIRCEGCDLVYAHPLPTEIELDSYYSSGNYFERVSNPFSESFYRFSVNLSRTRLRLLRSLTSLQDHCSVLDVGAGNAAFAAALKEFSEKTSYDAVEPDPNIRAQYDGLVRNCYPSLTQIDRFDYDLAVLNQVLEHVPAPRDFLGGILKFVKKGGFVFIDVPHCDYSYKPDVAPHILFWKKNAIATLFSQLEIETIFAETAGMPAAKASQFFEDSSFIGRISDPWAYLEFANTTLQMVGVKRRVNTFGRFQADVYGGNRQWLRAIGRKPL